MITPKNHEFTTQYWDYGHVTGTALEVEIRNFRWRAAATGPSHLAQAFLMQRFWRMLGAQ
jgi:hypothetical protein